MAKNAPTKNETATEEVNSKLVADDTVRSGTTTQTKPKITGTQNDENDTEAES